MFDIGWSELLILAIVTLLFVGPKDLPVFLRTIGRFTGAIRKQAGEFRAQFDEAMRESEFDQIRKDVSGLRDEVSGTVRQAARSVEDELNASSRELDSAAKTANTTSLPQAEPSPQAESAPQAKSLGSGANGSATSSAAPVGEPEKSETEPAAQHAPVFEQQTKDTEEKSRV